VTGCGTFQPVFDTHQRRDSDFPVRFVMRLNKRPYLERAVVIASLP
jgi:hypothetical protein